MYYYSNNENRDYIELHNVAEAREEDYDPSFYIKFTTIHGLKQRWEYDSKDLRDKDINQIRELIKK